MVNAPSNQTEMSDRLFGPPSTPAPSNYTSNFWDEFWNAVSSVVTNPLGTIESLAGVVWNEVTAAYAYVYYLRTEGLALGGGIVARTEIHEGIGVQRDEFFLCARRAIGSPDVRWGRGVRIPSPS